MAWGIFNKIKRGFQKAGKFLKKVFEKAVDVGEKVIGGVSKIAPIVAPIVAPAIDSVMPGAGTAINVGLDASNKALEMAKMIKSGKIRLK